MMKLCKLLSGGIPTAISIIALIVSCRSYRLSENNYEYEQSRDQLIYTPAIKEVTDSADILFMLNSENSELQGINITFPSSIRETSISINTKPIRLSKIAVEILAEKIVSSFIVPKDSVVSVGNFFIPVMIDYSAIVYGFPQTLRENRLLIFDVYCDDYLKMTYSNSFLVNRYSFPLKVHTFYTGPFASSLENRIKERDSEDVQILLSEQLSESIKHLIGN